jgi:CheY-like chemotaxis protein
MAEDRCRGFLVVADDEPSLRELMSEVLTDASYRVTPCTSGRAALDAIQRAPYDAVLSDPR